MGLFTAEAESAFREIGAPAFLNPFSGTAWVLVSIPPGGGTEDGSGLTGGGTALGFTVTFDLILIVLVFSD